MKSQWRWLWLLPVTLAIHLYEEQIAGARFYEWVDRPAGQELTSAEFLGLTSFALIGMTALTAVMWRWNGARFLAVSVSVAFFLNGVSHLINSLIAGGYTAGVLTGTVVWWPLALFVWNRCRRSLPPGRFRLGVLIGVGIQAGVMLTTVIFTVMI